MINAMGYNAPAREEVEVMFPEGSNCAQIFKILEENNVCTVEELEQWAAEGELDEYWFLEGVERGDRYCLEGYLAPDTYEFYTNDDPQRVLHKFLNEFDDRFTDLMKEDLEILQESFANALAANGTMLHMVNHSLLKLLLFLVAGAVYMNAHTLDLTRLQGFGRGKPLLHGLFLLGGLGLAGVPMFNGYASKTMIHEGMVELIHEHHEIFAYQVAEWVFLFAAGLTTAYMLKLYFCLFWQKNPDAALQEKYRIPYPAKLKENTGGSGTHSVNRCAGIAAGPFPQSAAHAPDPHERPFPGSSRAR